MGERGIIAAVIGAIVALPAAAAAHPTIDARLAAIEQRFGRDRTAAYYVEHAEVNREAGRWTEALADAERARALDPSARRPLILAAAIHYERGAPAEALPLLEAALAAHPDDPEARLLAARARRETGQLAASAAEYDRLLAAVAVPRPETYVERARVLAAQGRIDDATRGLDEGLTRLGMIAALQLAAVELEVDRRGFDAAVRRLDLLLERNPGQAFWLTRRAEILELGGKTAEARRGFELASQTTATRANVAALHDLDGRIRAGLARTTPAADAAADERRGGARHD